MSWLTTADLPPTSDEAGAMTHTSHDVTAGYEEKSGVANGGGLSYAWGVGLTTSEVSDEWELDGFDHAAAVAWGARPATRDLQTATINLGDGGAIIVLSYPYVASETVTSRSFSRSSDAGSYKLVLRKTTKTTTAVKLTQLTPED